MLRQSQQYSRFDRSHLSNQGQQLDRSQALQDSRLDVREDSNKLMSIIKLVSLILVIVLILYFIANPLVSNIFSIKKYFEKASGYNTKTNNDKYKDNNNVTENKTNDSFWNNWFSSDCKLCKLDKKEIKKGASVSKNLNKPNQIFFQRAQRNNQDLDSAVNHLLTSNSDIDNFDVNPMIDQFNNYVGYGNINPQSNPNEKKQVIENLNADKDKYQQPRKLLEDEYLIHLRELARDLNASNENQINKKKLLTQYREEIFLNISKLKECKQKLQDIKNNYDQEDFKIKGLQAELNDLQQQLQQVEDLLKQKGAPEDRSLLDKLHDFDRQISAYKNKLKGIPLLERKVQQKILQKSTLENKNDDNLDKIRDYQNKLDKAQLDKSNAQNQLRMLRQNLELKQQYTQIVEQNLKIAHDNFEIVKYTKDLFNPNSNIDELKKIHSQNIENQKKFLKKIKDYEQRVNNSLKDGYKIVSESKMEVINYEKDFQDNEKTYYEIESKYMELKKIIDDYEHRKLQFEIHQVKKKEHEDQIADIQRKIRDYLRQLDDTNKNIRLYGDYIDQLNNEITANNDTIQQITIYISENQPNRNELESQLSYLQQQRQSIADTLGAKKSQYESETKAYRQQQEDLQRKIYELRNKIKESEYNLNGLRNALKNQVMRCSGLQVNQDNLKNYLDYLQRDQAKDQDNIEKIKNELHKKLKELNNF